MTALIATLAGLLGLFVGILVNRAAGRFPWPPQERSWRSGADAPSDVGASALQVHDRAGKVAVRRPVLELGTAALFALVALRFGASWELPAFLFLAGVGVLLAIVAAVLHAPASPSGLAGAAIDGSYVRVAAALLTALWLVALVGFAIRYRRHGRDLDSWICLAATLAVFADLHLVLTPVVSSELVLQGDFLRVVAYGVLLVGVWRAVSEAEFGRAVADERARVARPSCRRRRARSR